MADAVLALLLLLSATAAVRLTLRARRYWRAERAGQVYELSVDRRGTALRVGAAALATLVAATLAVPFLRTSPFSPYSPSSVHAGATITPTASAGHAGPPARTLPPIPATPYAPPSPTRTPASTPPRTIGHPSGGTLQLLGDGTRVWLPPFYDSPGVAGIAFPVVLAHVDGAQGDPALYAGFTAAVRSHLADPFVLVMPAGCARDPGAVLAEAARRYRLLTPVSAHGVLGVGGQAACAVREALAAPGRYGAGVGISGTYPPLAPATLPRHPRCCSRWPTGRAGRVPRPSNCARRFARTATTYGCSTAWGSGSR